MRKTWTALLVAAVGGVALVALVDALVGGPDRSPPAPAAAPPATAPLPVCQEEQLALALETLGSSTTLALRHVHGGPCHLSALTISASVTNSHGVRSDLPLGDERIVDGDFGPGFEQLVGLTFCGTAPPFLVQARAGPYRVEGRGLFGSRCGSIQVERALTFERRPESRHFRIDTLDPSTHEVSFSIDLPRHADVRVRVDAGPGPQLEVLDRRRRDDCHHVGARDACLIRFGQLGEISGGVWTVHVNKRSQAPARISLAIAFIATTG